jgi:hypothetical protein
MRPGLGLAVVSSLLALSPTHAETIEKSVPGDRSSKIDHHTVERRLFVQGNLGRRDRGTVTHHIANGRI